VNVIVQDTDDEITRRAVPKGKVAAKFAMETEPLLKREGTIVYCMERRGLQSPPL
jgi:hypothetical protein